MPAIINTFNGTYIERVDTFVQNNHNTPASQRVTPERTQADDIQPIDTSFFCTDRFTVDIIEKNLRQVIELATSKADACRRIMALEPQGYIVLSNVKDERKAELVNPFAMPKFTLNGEDFRKARNS